MQHFEEITFYDKKVVYHDKLFFQIGVPFLFDAFLTMIINLYFGAQKRHFWLEHSEKEVTVLSFAKHWKTSRDDCWL